MTDWPSESAKADYDYDDDEPFVLENVAVGADDVARLAGLPLAASGCEFVACDLSAVSFHGVKQSTFRGCKLRGTRFTKHLTNVMFQDCQLNECTMRMMQLKDSAFENTQLLDCDFYSSELTRLAFAGSTVQGVGFDACTLHDVDLTQAASLIIGDPRTLKGSQICETQVPLIAARLAQLSGIDVHDC